MKKDDDVHGSRDTSSLIDHLTRAREARLRDRLDPGRPLTEIYEEALRGEDQPPRAARNTGEARRSATSDTAESRRVLVIDDSDVARTVMCDMLAGVGYEVYDLPSAIGATRLIQRQRIRAVIVDISMPGLSGDTLVEVLRKKSGLEDLVIIVVSGRDQEDLEVIRERCGADEALSKRDLDASLTASLARLLCRISSRRLGSPGVSS